MGRRQAGRGARVRILTDRNGVSAHGIVKLVALGFMRHMPNVGRQRLRGIAVDIHRIAAVIFLGAYDKHMIVGNHFGRLLDKDRRT